MYVAERWPVSFEVGVRGWVGKGILSINSLSRAPAGKVSDWVTGSHRRQFRQEGPLWDLPSVFGSLRQSSLPAPPPLCPGGSWLFTPRQSCFCVSREGRPHCSQQKGLGPALPERAFSVPMPRENHLCQPVAPPALLPAGARWGQSSAQERECSG